jgi:hypothetical protein
VSIKINVIRCRSHQLQDFNKTHNWQEFFCVLSSPAHSKYLFLVNTSLSVIMKLAFNLSQDENYRRIKGYLLDGTRALPGATGRYIIQKVPVAQWIGNYSPSWLINDLIAGLTVGVILVPQALAYAKIAGIPLQDGLLASWLPSGLYFIMGTSKGEPSSIAYRASLTVSQISILVPLLLSAS